MNIVQVLKWIYIFLAILSSVASVYLIGRPRDPRTPTEVVVNIVLNIFLVYLLLWN